MATKELLTRNQNDLMAGLKDFALKFSISVTLGVLLLLLGEVLSFVYLRLDPDPLPYSGLHLPADYARELEQSRVQQYLPYVDWRRSPYHGRFISVDSQGVRQTLNSHCDDEKNLVVWMFGDSALWGTGSTDAETIPSQLAKIYEDAGQKICVRNYGEAAWISTQGVIQLLLQLKLPARKPDIVIFYDGTNDTLMPTEGAAPPGAHLGYRRFRRLLANVQIEDEPSFRFLSRTNTARALDRISTKLYEMRHPGAKPVLPPEEAKAAAQRTIDNYQQNLQLVDSLAQIYGFKPFYYWYPTSSVGHKPLTAEEQIYVTAEMTEGPRELQVTRATYALCEKLRRPRFEYLGNFLDGLPQRLYVDVSHLTPEGNRLVAQHIFHAIQTSKVSSSP
jgi:lysophospholipase L1-like esterase